MAQIKAWKVDTEEYKIINSRAINKFMSSGPGPWVFSSQQYTNYTKPILISLKNYCNTLQ